MADLLLGSEVALAKAFDLALVDLDGVAYMGHEPIPYASFGLGSARDLGMQLVFVTNNASREPQDVADQLTGLDIPTRADEVMTAAQACARSLADHVAPGAKVLVVGGAGLITAVTEAGYQVVQSADDNPAAVAQGFHPSLGWAQLAEAAYAVRNGAIHVASNLDKSLPTDRGFAPGNGSLVLAVQSATGVEPFSAGKPSPNMYRMAVANTTATNPLVIGDRLDTDLAGARSGGYPGLHVLTGVNSARDDILAPASMRPHFIGADLRSLLEPHEQPVLRDGWWTCGDASVRVDGTALEISSRTYADGIDNLSQAQELDIVRAACNAAWSHVDQGLELDPSSVPHLLDAGAQA